MAVRHRLMALAWLAAALWLANAAGGCLGRHVPPPPVGAAPHGESPRQPCFAVVKLEQDDGLSCSTLQVRLQRALPFPARPAASRSASRLSARRKAAPARARARGNFHDHRRCIDEPV